MWVVADSATRRGWAVSATDLPAESRPELEHDAAGTDQFPVGRIVVGPGRGGPDIERRAVRKLAAQLAGGLLDLGINDRAPDQLSWVRRRPVAILGGETPHLSVRVANLDMQDIRGGDA